MTKFVAFLRGINVGGNNIIKMADLKICFEKNVFQNVSTFIQSGNVLFDLPAGGESKQIEKLEKKTEDILSKWFRYKSTVLVRSRSHIKDVLNNAPKDWKIRNDLRCYIAFIKQPVTPQQALKEVVIKEGIDFVTAGPGVLYMATVLNGLTKSGLNKIIGKKIYQSMTMRNYNTTQRIAVLMERD